MGVAGGTGLPPEVYLPFPLLLTGYQILSMAASGMPEAARSLE